MELLNLVESVTYPKTPTGALQLSPITLHEDYRKKWNAHYQDFVVLTRDEQLVNDSLYRVGGMGTGKLDGYFLLLKYTEAYYKPNILKMAHGTDPKHLEGCWCILDKNGVEKKVFDQFKDPYLVKDSCIYSLKSDYYNIETGEHYGHAYTHMESTDFLFLDTQYGKDKSRQGVLKIHKQTGTWELFG